MEGVWSIHIKKHFLSSVAWEVNTSSVAFCDIWWALSTRVEIHFVSLLEWDGFAQHMFRWFFCPRWHGIACVTTCWDTICVLPGMGWVCQSRLEMQFVYSLACGRFGQHKLRNILCPGWHWMTKVNTCDASCVLAGMLGGLFLQAWEELVNTCWDASYVLAGIGRVWSTQADMNFVSSMALVEFGQYMLRCIVCFGFHERG